MILILENGNNNEVLNYAIENGIINLSYIQDMIEMKKREEILNKHPYKIWEGKNESWYTYLPDADGKRKLVKKSTKEKIEKAIIDYWKELEENPTIDEIFQEWLDGKLEREEIAKSTFDRYKSQYKECFQKFGKCKIKDIEEYDIEKFMLQSIHDHNLTVKGFSNLRTLVLGIFKYARKKKYVTFSITNVISDIEIPKKIFRREKKDADELVFTEAEFPRILNYLNEDLDNIVNLAILLLFKTGMRVGELVSLKKEDIEGNTIHVHRTEVRYKGEGKEMIYEVRDFPKTEAGIRDIIIPDSALWILKRIQKLNPFGEYVFMRDGQRLKCHHIRMPLYTICRKAGVKPKSPNKIRKTYASVLLDKGADEALVISQMGHTDIKTTKGYYYKDRKSRQHKAEIINKIVDF